MYGRKTIGFTGHTQNSTCPKCGKFHGSRLGKSQSPETNAKHSASMKLKWKDPAFRLKVLANSIAVRNKSHDLRVIERAKSLVSEGKKIPFMDIKPREVHSPDLVVVDPINGEVWLEDVKTSHGEITHVYRLRVFPMPYLLSDEKDRRQVSVRGRNSEE